jgi:hypothetical protein
LATGRGVRGSYALKLTAAGAKAIAVYDATEPEDAGEESVTLAMRKLLKKYAFVPERLVTDDFRSYGAAARALGLERLHERGDGGMARKFASAEPTTGAQDAMFQERLLCAEIPLNPRRPLQHLQRPTPSHISSVAPRASRRGDDHVTRGRRGRLKFRAAVPLRVFVSIS